ncbi:hypothetical protein [Marinobacterium litorale]|uniref:hypothetical protein n=1 Tax=Marinobacterium litorale TaxID=404770 RepID=UPI00041CC40A|nr:hypothetical protein [Marinobacterium litorale]
MGVLTQFKQPQLTREQAIAQLRHAMEQAAPYFSGPSGYQFYAGQYYGCVGDERFKLTRSGYELEADLESVSRLSERRI